MFLLVFAGLAEGFGIAVLLPIISVLTDSVASENSTLEIIVVRALDTFGLEREIGVLLTIVVIGIAAKATLLMFSMSLVGTAMAQTSTDLRMGFMRAILAANWPFFTNTKVGKITNAMSRESDRAAALLAILARLMAAIISVTILLTLAWLVSRRITAAALATGVLLIAVLSRVVGIARRAGFREATAYGELSGRLTDAIQGIKWAESNGAGKLVGAAVYPRIGRNQWSDEDERSCNRGQPNFAGALGGRGFGAGFIRCGHAWRAADRIPFGHGFSLSAQRQPIQPDPENFPNSGTVRRIFCAHDRANPPSRRRDRDAQGDGKPDA